MFGKENKNCSLAVCCCNSCSGNSCCSQVTNEQLVNLSNNVKKEIEKTSKSRINNLTLGYPAKSFSNDYINVLSNYDKIIVRYRKAILVQEPPCLCACKFNKLIEKINKLVGKDCSKKCREDVVIEERLDWIINNPHCVAAARWEKLVYQVCFDLSMDVELVSKKDLHSIVYEITKKELTCNIVAAFSVYDKVCKLTHDIDISSPLCTLTFDINKSKKECQIQYENLITTTKCDLSFKKYMQLLECRLNHSIIADVYGKSLRLDIVDDKPHLVTSSNSYNICDLKFTELSTNNCEILDFKPEITEYLKSYNL